MRPTFGPQAVSPACLSIPKNIQLIQREATPVYHVDNCECPQSQYLRCKARMAFFGGGVFGGKSFAELMLPLRWRKVNGFQCTILRLDRPRIMQEGGLWDTSKLIYSHFGAEPNENLLRWRFPGGANVKLGFLMGESGKSGVQKKDGAQAPLIQYDEVQEFTRKQVFYMLTRNRSNIPGIPAYIRGTLNPDPDNAPWLSEFLQWYWDPATGYIIPERSGVIRYFVYLDNTVHWADTGEELKEKFGPDCDPISFTFIRSMAEHNLIGLKNNPEYLKGLKNQDPITVEIKLKGNFKVSAAKGTKFNRAWFEVANDSPYNGRIVRFWDLAGIDEDVAQEKGTDPDYVASCKMKRRGKYFIEDITRGRMHPNDTRRLIRRCAEEDGYRCAIRIEMEGGSHTKFVEAEFLEMLAGYDVEFVRPMRSKVVRASGYSSSVKAKNIVLVRKPDNWYSYLSQAFFSEHEAFPRTGPGIHDDIVDCCSGAYNYLASEEEEPTEEELKNTAVGMTKGIESVPWKGRWGR